MCQMIRSLQQSGNPRIAVGGGDGTVHSAIQCFPGTESELAIIPMGTHNNFAHALGLPLELEHAVALLETGTAVAVDLGKVKDVYFTEAAGVGVFANILDLYGESHQKFWRGLYAIAKTLLGLRARRLRLTIDGRIVSERAVMCTVANGYRLGTGASIAPGASVVDGLLDVVILGDLSRIELFQYFRATTSNAHLHLPKVERLQACEVRIESATPLALHIDDHVVGKTPAVIEIAPKSLKVVVKS